MPDPLGRRSGRNVSPPLRQKSERPDCMQTAVGSCGLPARRDRIACNRGRGGPVRPAAEQAAQSLRDEILSGAIASGTRLGEADLASRLSVSRTPIRDALSRLAAEGLVE